MVRPPLSEKLNVKRDSRTADNGAKLLLCASKHVVPGTWSAVPKKAGIKRCGKSCKSRCNHRSEVKCDNFSPQEEELIIKLHAAIGSRWAIIAQQLPGRTDMNVKNCWNTKLRKKLSALGIDPITHRPFSQIFADYGNISGLQKPSTGVVPFPKDDKNGNFINSEPYLLTFPNIHSQSIKPSALPKTEPMENSFLANTTNRSHNHSVDLLAELQSIEVVASASTSRENDQTNIPPPMFGEGCLSSTSSPSYSSTCSTAAKENSTTPFSWHEFLLEDAFQRVGDIAEQEYHVLPTENVSQPSDSKRAVNSRTYCEYKTKNDTVPSNYGCRPNRSASDVSFVDAMFDQEDEMFMNFPSLMEETYY